MSAPRRHPGTVAGGLSFDLIDFLLRVHRSSEEIVRLEEQGIEYDGMLAFDLDRLPISDFLELWEQYEPQLREEATRRGLPLPDPREYRPRKWIRR